MTDPAPGFTVAHDPTQLFSRGAWFELRDFGTSLWFAAWPDGLQVVDENGTPYTVARYRQGVSGKEHQRLENHTHWLIVMNGKGKLERAPVGAVVKRFSKARRKELGVRYVFV